MHNPFFLVLNRIKDNLIKVSDADTREELNRHTVNIIFEVMMIFSCIVFFTVLALYFVWDLNFYLVVLHSVFTGFFVLLFKRSKEEMCSRRINEFIVGIAVSIEYTLLFLLLYSNMRLFYWFTLLIADIPLMVTSLYISFTVLSFTATMLGIISAIQEIKVGINVGNSISLLVILVVIILVTYWIGFTFKYVFEKKRQKSEILIRQKEKLHQLAYYDALTGLPNRKFLINQVEVLVEKCIPFWFVYFDIDDFKNVNETISHFVGDKLLASISQKMLEKIQTNDILAYMGGDEFVYIVNRNLSEKEVLGFVTDLLEFLNEPIIVEGYDIYVNMSCGVAHFPTDSLDAIDILKAAETAMYATKQNKRTSIYFYNSSLGEKIAQRIRMEAHIKNALTENEFEIVYQPIMFCADKHKISFEALLRWNSKKMGYISPDLFIPICEDSCLIHEIGLWVILEVCKTMVKIQKKWNKKMFCSVNVSPLQLKRINFVDNVKEIIDSTGVDPSSLTLELTESAFIDKDKSTLSSMFALGELGLRKAIDDFGTGYSSFNYLPTLPVEILKIDKSFIDRVIDSSDYSKMVESIITIGHDLGMEVTAEGIESKEQSIFLKAVGCDYIQGYYYGRPFDSKYLEEYVLNFESRIDKICEIESK